MRRETVVDVLLVETDFPDSPTMGEAAQLLGEAGGNVKALRRLLGRRRERAQAQARETRAQTHRVPPHSPLELYIGPGGVIYDAAEQRAEATRWATARRSLEAKHESERLEREPEAEARRVHDAARDAARDAELRRLTPPGVAT